MIDVNDGQMTIGDLGGLTLPDICLTGEEKPRKNVTQETYPDRGSNPGTLRDRRACCRLAHSGELLALNFLDSFPWEIKIITVRSYSELSSEIRYQDEYSMSYDSTYAFELSGDFNQFSVSTLNESCIGYTMCDDPR